MNMERMNEQPRGERETERTPEAAYEAVLRDPVIYGHYEGVFKGTLRELQLGQNDLNFPLTERQVDAFVVCLQMALDGGQCGDSQDAIAGWIERNLRCVRRANEWRKRRPARATV
jgi:hypothetical protein